MILRATGNYGFWCREDHESEEDATFLFGRHWEYSRVWCMSITISFVLSRVVAILLNIAILFHPASLLRALRWLALWLLTRPDKLTEYSVALSAGVGVAEGARSGFASESRSKLLICPADQPTASGLVDKTFRAHAVLITNMEDGSNQLADTSTEAESPTQHSGYMYARASRWVQAILSSPPISAYVTLHKADQTINCES
jgi:hypothetical protein